VSISRVGQRGEIRPAYNSETGQRDIWDEIAGCAAEVIRDTGAELVVWIPGRADDVHIAPERFRPTGRAE